MAGTCCKRELIISFCHSFGQNLLDSRYRRLDLFLVWGCDRSLKANVSDLAKPFLKDMSLPAITKHLQVLEKAGLITKTREAQWRQCTFNGDALKDVADWMEQYRMFWEQSFDRLDAYLKTVTSTTRGKGKKHGQKK